MKVLNIFRQVVVMPSTFSTEASGSPTIAAPALPSATAFLRFEAVLAAGVAIVVYAYLGLSWWLFGALILVPDVAMLGYLGGPRVGAMTYNLAHTYIAPAVLAGLGYLFNEPLISGLAAIWCTHIALDRVLGYGLKLGGDFKASHLSGPGSSH